ncbi:MAG: BrnA antitoxin family protein, partial [Rhizobiaceae bacterium]
MNKPSKKPLSIAELATLPDETINYDDIPELDEAFWSKAVLVYPDKTQQVTLRVKSSVLDAYKALGKGYQTQMNRVLETYAKT